MAETFKVGDLVQLRSGGPVMTVDKVGLGLRGNDVQCQWFSGSKLNEGTFDGETLVRAKKAGEEKAKP